MSNKFKSILPEADWHEGRHLRSPEEAIDVLKDLAPDYKCPVCSSDVFVMEEDFQNKLRTSLIRYQLPAVESVNFDTLVSISCDNCGFVMSFNEEKLKSKLTSRG